MQSNNKVIQPNNKVMINKKDNYQWRNIKIYTISIKVSIKIKLLIQKVSKISINNMILIATISYNRCN